MIINYNDLSIDAIKKGYIFEQETGCYECIECGARYEEDEIFHLKNRYFTAKKMIKYHMNSEHGNRLNTLLSLDKKLTAITDNQKEVLSLIASNMSNTDIASQLKLSPSTVRHMRFTMKEKAKQAKVFLALYELTFDDNGKDASIVAIHPHATMIDDRYKITTDEETEVIEKMFTSLEPLKLKTFSTKEKKKIVILRKIVSILDKSRHYTEKELNAVLKDVYHDYVTIRRYLIEYGFMDRSRDGSDYWIK